MSTSKMYLIKYRSNTYYGPQEVILYSFEDVERFIINYWSGANQIFSHHKYIHVYELNEIDVSRLNENAIARNEGFLRGKAFARAETEEALLNAGRFLRGGGAHAVKLEALNFSKSFSKEPLKSIIHLFESLNENDAREFVKFLSSKISNRRK